MVVFYPFVHKELFHIRQDNPGRSVNKKTKIPKKIGMRAFFPAIL